MPILTVPWLTVPVCQPCAQCLTDAVPTIEQVGVVWPWESIEVPDVEQVIVLPVDIPTHCEVLVLWNVYVHKGGHVTEQLAGLRAEGTSTTLMLGVQHVQLV